MIGKFNGSLFLMIEEFDGSFLIRAFLIERECVYLKVCSKFCNFVKFKRPQKFENFYRSNTLEQNLRF